MLGIDRLVKIEGVVIDEATYGLLIKTKDGQNWLPIEKMVNVDRKDTGEITFEIPLHIAADQRVIKGV